MAQGPLKESTEQRRCWPVLLKVRGEIQERRSGNEVKIDKSWDESNVGERLPPAEKGLAWYNFADKAFRQHQTPMCNNDIVIPDEEIFDMCCARTGTVLSDYIIL